MADVEASVEIEVEGAGSLRDAAEAARSLADALKQAEASAGSISGAFGSAAEAAGKLRDDAEEAAKALKSIRDAGLGVSDVAPAAEAAARGLASVKDEAGEAEAAIDSLSASEEGVAGGAAAAEAEASALGHVRDEALEAAAAEATLAEAQGHARDSAAEQDAALAGSAAQYAQMADAVKAAKQRYTEYGASMGGAKQAEADAAAVAKDLSDGNLGLAQSSIAATDAITESDKAIASANDAYREADNYISAAEGSLDKAAGSATNASGQYAILGARVRTLGNEMHNFSDTAKDATSTDDDFSAAAGELSTEVGRVGQSVRDADAAAGAFKATTRDAASGLRDVDSAAKDGNTGLTDLRKSIDGMASSPGINFLSGSGSGWLSTLFGNAPDIALGTAADIENISKSMEDAESSASGFGDSLSSAFGPITSKLSPMSGMIAGLVGLVGGLGPAMATAFAGSGVAVGGFAALAIPTLSKIASAYEGVSSARSTWTKAEQTAQLDPTKANLSAAASDAEKLKLAYQEIPSSVRPVVKAIGTLQAQYDSMAKSFQPEVIKTVGNALSLASEGMSQFLKPAANLGGSLINKGLSDLQTFIESPGAVKTFNDLLKETPGAVKSAGSAISSVGKFIGDAFGGVGVKGSESFIKSFDGLLKAIGPGAGTAVKGLAGGLQDIMNDATQAAPQIGKIAGSLGALEKVNLSSLTSQVQGLLNLGNQAGGGEGKGKGNILTQILGDADQYEKDYAALPKGLTSRFGTAAKQALSDIIPGLGSGLKPQTLHWPVTVDPKVDVKSGHIDKGALEKSLGAGGAGLPLQVKVEPKFDPEQMQKSLTSTGVTGGKVPVPAEAKVDKADTSGLKGSDTKVPATAQVDKVDSSGISKAASNVKIHGVTVDLSNAKLAGLGALSSSLSAAGSSAGHSFDTGVASGITSGAGAATSAAQHVVTEIKAALATLGAAGSAAGAALGAGLAAGIAGSTGAAVAAATRMANEVTAAVKAAHATQSPSKVFKGIGASDVQGLILGLEGGKSQLNTAAKDMAKGITAPFTDAEITDTFKKLTADLKDSLKAGTIDKSQDTGISAWLDSDNKRLMALAKQRKTIEANISAADALYKSVDTATIQGANVVTFAGNVTSGASSGGTSADGSSGSSGTPQPTAAYTAAQNQQVIQQEQSALGSATAPKLPLSLTANDTIQGQLQQYLSQTRAFSGDIKKLKSEGLDSTSLQQLLQAGVSGGGLSTSKMMLSGGTKGVQEIAGLQKQIAAAAKQLGTTGANATYESGSQIGEGLAQGLKSELGSVTTAIKSLASQIVSEMQKDLKIHSPSMVAWDMGSQFAAGMAGGITSGGPMVGAAARELAIVASRGASGGSGGRMTASPMPIVAGGGGGGGGSQTFHMHLEVGGQEIAQVVQTYTLQHARRNTGSGLQLAGRGT